MKNNPLIGLEALGQSIWIDFIRRGTITSGELEHLVLSDGVSGVTSNPSIFDKAIGGSHDYDEDLMIKANEGKTPEQIYEELTVKDIQMTADVLRPVYDRLNGADGFVSLEVSPHLSHDTQRTVIEARSLWAKVNRPNLMIKVPATREGLPAIRQLIGEGINVNITLLFGLPRYREVIEAYISGIEDRVNRGASVEHIASVASFFLSRIDVLVDPKLEKIMQEGGQNADLAKEAHGEIAIASARVAYQIYQEVVASDRFRRLAEKGAQRQRLLWASTSTKNPSYSDVKYIEPLIGPETINTLPLETLDAYRDHGKPEGRLTHEVDKAHEVIDILPTIGIDLDAATQQLEDEGVEKFNKSYDELLNTIREKSGAALKGLIDRQVIELGLYQSQLEEALRNLENEHFSERIWKNDASLWKSDAGNQATILNGLGWLLVTEKMEETLPDFLKVVEDLRKEGFERILLMGMGGSSLAPLVFERTFKPGKNGMALTVLDTTDPETILKMKSELPLDKTLFVVSSKSGTTAEPIAFESYFYAETQKLMGENAASRFIVITDPNTPLEDTAKRRNYRRVITNYPDIGGRYSALSYFGLVPVALMGIDVADLLERAGRMVHACASCIPTKENPGLILGAALGALANHGRNKVTFILPGQIETLGAWLEQLLAESTGKEGKGLLPVTGEPVATPDDYGDDRLFVYFRLDGIEDTQISKRLSDLKKAGYPVITIQMQDIRDITQEFFRWEMATAVAGAIMGINPFDQPNVQESKDNTNRLVKVVRNTGKLPENPPVLMEGPITIDGKKGPTEVKTLLSQLLNEARPGDYFALLAYIPENSKNDGLLQSLRADIASMTHLPVTIGYGPRYLHSTGQLHKGGPNNGIFIELTVDEPEEVTIPGETFTFNVLNRAQALGDLEALRKHNRRAIRVHLESNVERGINYLRQVLEDSVKVR